MFEIKAKTAVGTCYLGYSNPGSGYDTYDYSNPLITGEFSMTWVYANSASAQVNGYVNILKFILLLIIIMLQLSFFYNANNSTQQELYLTTGDTLWCMAALIAMK